ncbi:hypothetical protein JTB14_032443 [Gonioctena quinquepunctata]|nr:hypothetical protein JTB14_032443 [Gonioctena quinquepunctata]
MTIPGTPLPSLVQDSSEEFPEISVPVTPVEKEQVADPESLYFRDGRRKIDMVLVYEEEEYGVMTEAEAKRRDRRKTFQENLVKEGLELELEHKDLSFDGRTWFLKIHLPWKTKSRYAAVMGMRMPIKRFITISVKAWVANLHFRRPLRCPPLPRGNRAAGLEWAQEFQNWDANEWATVLFTDESRFRFHPDSHRTRLWRRPGKAERLRHVQEVHTYRGGTLMDDKKDQIKSETTYSRWRKKWKDLFEYNHDLISQEPSFYDATEGGDREEQFVVKDRVTSYSSAQRSLIVMQILLRVKFDDTDKVGIRRLLNDYTYIACFPLHEGRWNKESSDGKLLDRRVSEPHVFFEMKS